MSTEEELKDIQAQRLAVRREIGELRDKSEILKGQEEAIRREFFQQNLGDILNLFCWKLEGIGTPGYPSCFLAADTGSDDYDHHEDRIFELGGEFVFGENFTVIKGKDRQNPILDFSVDHGQFRLQFASADHMIQISREHGLTVDFSNLRDKVRKAEAQAVSSADLAATLSGLFSEIEAIPKPSDSEETQ